MLPMNASLTILSDFTRDLIGLPITHVWRGHYSAIFLEFGELIPSTFIRRDGSVGHSEGQFGLMIDADWRIENARSILCGSRSDCQLIDIKLASLQGLAVKGVNILGRLPEMTLMLTQDTYVVTFKSDEEGSQWALADRRNCPPTRWLSSQDGGLEIEVDPGATVRSTAE